MGMEVEVEVAREAVWREARISYVGYFGVVCRVFWCGM